MFAIETELQGADLLTSGQFITSYLDTCFDNSQTKSVY